MDTDSKNWKEFWSRRSQQFTIESPAYISGWFDRTENKGYKISNKAIEKAINLLELKKGDRLLDIGCGAGVFAEDFFAVTNNYIGTDYIESLIFKAKKEKPGLKFMVAAANRIPFKEGSFNKIVAMSVFHYFPSYAYAQEAVNEMKRVCCPGGKILIFDVPDVNKRGLAAREKETTQLQHLLYERSFFAGRVFDQDIKNYINSPFRFNVLYDAI